MYSQYEKAIARIARKLTQDIFLREDLKQEMRLSLWKSGAYEDKSGINSYHLWIAKNRAIDFIRKFYTGDIPFGDMNDIDRLIYDTNDDEV